MSGALRDLCRRPGTPSVYEAIYAGAVRWDLLTPFPRQDAADRALGDQAISELTSLVTERVDPTDVDERGALPDGLVDALRDRGFLKLATEPGLGGRGLSYLNVFRLIQAAASWSVPVGLVMAAEAGVGVPAFLPAVPPGPLRDQVRSLLAKGVVTGGADTEPSGAANQRRLTTATPVEDGTAYLVTGEKVHTGNGPIADLLVVTATVREGDEEHIRLFFVDMASPGVRIRSRHEFMGIKGFPNAALGFDRVRVPRERMLVEQPFDSRITPSGITISARGRMFLIAAPSLAIAKGCARGAREFARRRTVDGMGLGEYDEVQRLLADSLADVFAIETLAEWSLLADHPAAPVNPIFEQLAAKNICSLACWRVVERTMSLLASEGFETASSKASRGIPPTPLERLFRDARGLRISGGVDFQLDNWAGRYILSAYYDGDTGELAGDPEPGVEVAAGTAELSPANREHLAFVAADARALSRTCLDLVRRYPDQETLFARERVLILLSQLANELLAMSLVLARAAGMAAGGNGAAGDLAEVFCTAARHRLADAWGQLRPLVADDGRAAGFVNVADGWLRGGELDFLLDGVIDEGTWSRG